VEGAELVVVTNPERQPVELVFHGSTVAGGHGSPLPPKG